MKIIPYSQLTEDILISGSSTNIEYLYNNLLDQYGTIVMKFTGYTDEWLVFDAGAGNTINLDAFSIVNHNIAESATIEIEGNATDAWGSPSYSQSLTWNEYLILNFLNTFEYRFLRLHIQNSANEPIQFGIVFPGTALEIPNVLANIRFGFEVNQNTFLSDSGNSDGNGKSVGRIIPVTFREMPDTYRKLLSTVWKTNGSHTNIIAALYENNFELEQPLYCRMENFTAFEKKRFKYDGSFTLREVF